MTRLQRIQLKLSELRSKMADQLDKTPEEREDGAIERLTREMQQTETEHRAALMIESDRQLPADQITTPEGREIAEMHRRASLFPYFHEATDGKALDGAEAELRSALLGDGAPIGSAPLDILLTAAERAEWLGDAIETRAVTPVAAAALTQGNQQLIAGRVFSRSLAARLGIPMPSVGVGSAGYPHLTTGTTFSNQAEGGEQAAVAGVFGGVELNPIRASASYEWSVENEAKLRGIEAALRRDLRDGMTDHLDNQLINGNGTAPNVQGVLAAVAATPTTDPADADTFGELLVRFLSEVDGINAYEGGDLQVILSSHAYRHLIGTYSTAGSHLSAYAALMAGVGGLVVSSRLPAAADNISNSIVYKSSFPERSAVMPIWRAINFVTDPYTLATKGERRLTAIVLYNFKILAATAFAVRKIRSA